MSDLIADSLVSDYDLASELFTDYADKKRMIFLPKGTNMKVIDENLLDFPDNTIIAKTFYYKDHFSSNKTVQRIIETRLLLKSKSVWNAATYHWNEEQSEAYLLQEGKSLQINFMDNRGDFRTTMYKIPSMQECASCHRQDDRLSPIGPKVRNLQLDVFKDGSQINQLHYFVHKGILDTFSVLHASMPSFSNTSNSVEDRARAYLDINCAHCHNEKGFAYYMNLNLSYETAIEESNILQKSSKIATRMAIDGELHMPQIGTTLNDEDGIKLIVKYLSMLDE